MDFFERQRVARRQSVRLVALFVLAVVAIAAITAAVLTLAIHLFILKTPAGNVTLAHFWREPLPWLAAILTTAVIGGASIAKRRELSGGGDVLARALGGRPVSPATKDLKQRQLLNVVEELALAAGTPVPRVFVLEGERGINAFAAGLEPANAAIGVTRGAMELLTRDELQGVLGHEFSHIVNGDMALNVRLIGLLHGILVLALVGRRLMVPTEEESFGRRIQRRKPAPLVLGALLWAVGSIGVFFARLIKASVSRERERLADAAAVQFTRNALGLAGALEKIGGLADGSRMNAPLAEAASHLFFGDGVGRGGFEVFPTHPPLLERIRLLDPSFDGHFPAVQPLAEVHISLPVSDTEHRVPVASLAAGTVRADPRVVSDSIGQPRPEHLEHARAVRGAIGTRLTEAVRGASGAEAVVYALLLDRDPAVRKRQRVVLASHPDETVLRALHELLADVDRCPAGARLPLLDLALPSLRALSLQQYRFLRDHVQKLVDADRKVTLFEYTLHRALLRHLDVQFLRARPPATQHSTLKRLQQPCAVVLSALAYLGQSDDAAVAAAFAAGVAELGSMEAKPRLADRAACPVQAVHEALTRLATVAAQPKAEVLRACVATVGRGGVVTVGEAELLRAVADCLGCPMPPLLPVDGAEAGPAASAPQQSARTSTAP